MLPASHTNRKQTPRTKAPTHELWRLRGATDELRGLSVETSFGHAFALELDHEIVLLHLQPSLEVLTEFANRINAALLAQGWQPATSSSPSQKEPA